MSDTMANSAGSVFEAALVPEALSQVRDLLLCGPFESKYEVLDKLGQGCFATVHRCRSRETGQLYAVKVQPLNQLSPRHLEALEREIQCHKGMDHVNIVKLHEVVVWNGAVFLVQELMEGGDVAELLLRRGPLPEADVVLLLRSVLSAVCELHDKGIAHRDLKPANVLLPASGAARPDSPQSDMSLVSGREIEFR